MRALAKKGSIYLVKYDNGAYGVEKIVKAYSYGLLYTEDKVEAIDFFNEVIKKVRSSKNDFNLNIYAF